MNLFKRFITILLIFIVSSPFFIPVFSQSSSQSLSGIDVNSISDDQLQQLMQQGFSDADIVQNAESKGMPVSQAQKLLQRISALRGSNPSVNNNVSGTAALQTRRTNNFTTDSMVTLKKTDASAIPIFGADIFRSSNTTFEPNLKIATPSNYILGPDDEVDINVYGNSIVNWKLNVSPDGNINMPSGGIVNVAGKTIEEATSLIKGRLISKNYSIGQGSSLKVTLGNIRSIKVILVGEVFKPGSYTLPSLATAFNALYAAGGPNDNGSFRQIEIIRNNRIIRHLDIYNFLLKGDQKDNISLEDQDIIRIPTFQTRVEIKGEVKRHALFEVLPGESLLDVIRFAGGFTSSAYRASITVSTISDQQKRLTDVTESNFKNYIPLPGDVYTVQGILNRFENRVTINGAVFRPGEYELANNMTLSQLIAKASGLTEDAFTGRGTITRLNPDNTTQVISFSVADVLNKSFNIALQREDAVTITSIFSLRNQYTVKISGEVRNPGDFAYADSMKVENLILLAGGFSMGASTMHIEVARRIYIGNSDPKDGTIATVYSVDVDSQLKLSSTNFSLKPFDIVLVYKLPGYQKQEIVKLEGEVVYPGSYVIKQKDEKISDIIKRAGGLTSSADVGGSTLKRNYIAFLGVNSNSSDSVTLAQEHLQRVNQLKQTFSDSTNSVVPLRNNFIGIDLSEILAKPGSATDLVLKDGDLIRIPQLMQVVQVNGEVHVPSGVVYRNDKSFNDYVFDAGGYTDDALKRGAYIIYPNGTVRGTHKILFFNNHPEVKPGSEIFVPKKRPRSPLNLTELLGIISALGTTVILAILSFRH